MEMPAFRPEMPEKRVESPLCNGPANPIAHMLTRARPIRDHRDAVLRAPRERNQWGAYFAKCRWPGPLGTSRMYFQPGDPRPRQQLRHDVERRIRRAALSGVMRFLLTVSFFRRSMCTEHVSSKSGTAYDVR